MKKSFSILMATCLAIAACGQAENGTQVYDWEPAGDAIRTRWAAEVTPGTVHQEYPRPQLVRKDWKSLNGLWEYAVKDSSEASMTQSDGHILVPFCIESSLSGAGRTISAEDAIWYRTSFEIPKNWKGRRIMLNFGAVDWKAEVYVNGMEAGSHTGGYTSFSFDITPYLRGKGEQVLTVKVTDDTNGKYQPRGKQTDNPSGIWYTAVSGIWQSVWMEPVSSSAYLADYEVSSDIASGTLNITPICSDAMDGDMIEVSLIEGKVGYDPQKPGQKVIDRMEVNAGGTASFHLSGSGLWSPDNPYLYGLSFKVKRSGRTLDEVDAYTAMRSVSTVIDEEGIKRIGINGQPLYNHGPLDQGWWPDGLYTAPSDEALKYDIEMTKKLGFNMIRKHIKVEPARWYYYCDQIGIMVWQDMPSITSGGNIWAQDSNSYDTGTDYPASDECKANFLKEWSEIIAQLKKNQCIVMWVPFNEAWSQFDTKDVVAFTYKQDGSRLVNHASGGNWVSGGVGDVIDSHHYPEPFIRIWDPELIVVLGEYGGIGRPVEGHLWQKDRNWGYIEFQSADEVSDEYIRFIDLLKPLVLQGCSASVYTQTTDVEGEVNGLMTYDRDIVKVDIDRIAAANRSIISLLSE